MTPPDGAELKLFENMKRLWPQECGPDTWYPVVVSAFGFLPRLPKIFTIT
jgi:hypothetical protein